MATVLEGPGAGWDWRNANDAMRERTAQDEAARQRNIARSWAYYDGDMPPQIKVRSGDYDDNVRLEYPALIIDTSVAFLFGANLKFTCEDDSRQEAIDLAWGTEEQKMVTLQRLGINGAVSGHAYVKLQPLEEGVRILVLDPGYVDVDWATDDFTKVLAYHVEWSGFDRALGRSVSYRQDVTLQEPDADGPWLIEDFRSVGNGGWIPLNPGGELWDFPFAPIVDCQNLPTANEFYGAPDMGEADLDLVDRINMAATNIQKILRYHAHPKVFIYGYSGKEIDLSVDSAVNFPSTETSVGILGMPTDLGAAFQMLDRLTDALLRQTRTPRAALGDAEAAAAAASGLALKLSFMPLVDKTGQKRETYGFLLNEVNQRIQAILGQDPSEVELEWPSITPDDPQMEVQTALLKQQAGIAKATTIAELGYDPDIEHDKKAEEDQEAVQAMQAAMDRGEFGAGNEKVVNEDSQGASTRAAQQDRRSRDLLDEEK